MKGYEAQYKYDDWRVLIYFFPDGKIRFFSRKKAPLPRYHAPESLLRALKKLDLPHHEFHILDGGLIHYRTERVKDTVVLWDVLVYEGTELTGTNYKERYALLKKISHDPKEKAILDGVPIALKIAPKLWLAPLIHRDFKSHFDRASRLPEIEGIVLKKMDTPLEHSHRMESNARWMIRVRKPRIDYSF